VRVVLDLLLSLSVPTRGSPLLSYLLALREFWPLLRSNYMSESFNFILESSGSATPLEGYSRSPGP